MCVLISIIYIYIYIPFYSQVSWNSNEFDMEIRLSEKELLDLECICSSRFDWNGKFKETEPHRRSQMLRTLASHLSGASHVAS